MKTKSVKRRILGVIAVLLFAASALCGTNALREHKSQTKDSDDFKALARLVEIAPKEPMKTKESVPSPTPIGAENTHAVSEAPYESALPNDTPHTAQNTPNNTPNDAEAAPIITPSEPAVTLEASAPRFLHDIPRLIGMNSDCIGWLSIEGTAVDYPVMHTPNYPQKYLRMNFFGESSSAGVPFMDYRCDLNSGNIIVYGHNMRNGTMFASLKNDLKREYANTHPTILFETEEAVHEFRVFAAAIVSIDDAWYGFVSAESEKAFNRAVQRIFLRSYITIGTMPEFGDRILTLSTCHSSGSGNRLIVLAAEQRPAIPLCWDPNHPIFKFHVSRRG